jgi:hypothetical protein
MTDRRKRETKKTLVQTAIFLGQVFVLVNLTPSQVAALFAAAIGAGGIGYTMWDNGSFGRRSLRISDWIFVVVMGGFGLFGLLSIVKAYLLR